MRCYDRLTQAVLRRPVELGLAAVVRVVDDVDRLTLLDGRVPPGRVRSADTMPSPRRTRAGSMRRQRPIGMYVMSATRHP
jgi:hypothetical protein